MHQICCATKRVIKDKKKQEKCCFIAGVFENKTKKAPKTFNHIIFYITR